MSGLLIGKERLRAIQNNIITYSNSEAKSFKERYKFDITRYYCIWFSSQPDVFLDIENQLRLIRWRIKNPRATLSLLYSSECLNESSKEQAKKFCTKHKIALFDFDEDLYPFLEDKLDKKVFEIANSELKQARGKKHGNLAAASDCARILVPVIKKLGIYSELDISCQLSTLNAEVLELRAPVLLNSEVILDSSFAILSPNSDFLAFSFNPDNPTELSAEALLAVRFVQQALIKKYSSPFTMKTLFGDAKQEMKPAIRWRLDNFFKTEKAMSNKANIFDFRCYPSTLPSDTLEEKTVKFYLSSLSVVGISGPSLYTQLYKQLFPPKFSKLTIFLIPLAEAWYPYLGLYMKSSLGYYDQIAELKLVETRNRILAVLEYSETLGSGEQPAGTSDLSWLEEGQRMKEKRNKKIEMAAHTFQNFWRRKKQRESFRLKTAPSRGCSTAAMVTIMACPLIGQSSLNSLPQQKVSQVESLMLPEKKVTKDQTFYSSPIAKSKYTSKEQKEIVRCLAILMGQSAEDLKKCQDRNREFAVKLKIIDEALSKALHEKLKRLNQKDAYDVRRVKCEKREQGHTLRHFELHLTAIDLNKLKGMVQELDKQEAEKSKLPNSTS